MNAALPGSRPVANAALRVSLFCWLASCSGFAGDGLNWQTGAGYRWSDLPVPKDGRAGFKLLSASETGIRFTNLLSEAHALTNRNLLSGSGVAGTAQQIAVGQRVDG